MSEPAYFAHARGRPSTWEISAIRSLGPRIKWSAINTSEHQYNQTLFAEVADPSHYQDYTVYRMLPNGDCPRRIASQLLGRKVCRDGVVAYEQARGRPYEVFARVRLDTQLFAPVPASFFANIGRADAVIPAGQAFGAPGVRSVNDRFLVGGAEAFRADAEVWKTVIDPAARGSAPWIRRRAASAPGRGESYGNLLPYYSCYSFSHHG